MSVIENPPNLENEIKTIIKTGKYVLGSRRSLKLLKLGKLKSVIMAASAPTHIKEDIKYYAKLSQTPVFIYKGTSYELGAVCGKPFGVLVIGVLDPGDSKLLELQAQG